jgi:hypothetical protein
MSPASIQTRAVDVRAIGDARATLPQM